MERSRMARFGDRDEGRAGDPFSSHRGDKSSGLGATSLGDQCSTGQVMLPLKMHLQSRKDASLEGSCQDSSCQDNSDHESCHATLCKKLITLPFPEEVPTTKLSSLRSLT